MNLQLIINTLMLLSSLSRKLKCADHGKYHKNVPLLLPLQLLNNLNHMLNTNIKDAPNFIRISIFSMKKSYLKITHELLRTKLCEVPPDFIFFIYYHWAIDVIESKICKLLPPQMKKKPPQNVCSILFEKKGVEFINTACFLRDPSSSAKFPMPVVIYKLTPPPCTKCFNFNNLVNKLDLDLFLTNQDNLSCNCKNSHFAERHHKHIVTVDLWIIRNYALRKLFVKGPKYKEVRSIKSERAKYCILEGLDNCFLSWCCKNSVEKYFFLEWTNYIKIKINERRVI